MVESCLNCETVIAEGTQSCPECGESFRRIRPGFSERISGGAAYFTVIPCVVFLLLARFKSSAFIRFHCYQSISLFVAAIALAGLLRLIFVTLYFIPLLVASLIVTIACLGCVLLWAVVVIKALQGKMYKLPILGAVAEKQAKI